VKARLGLPLRAGPVAGKGKNANVPNKMYPNLLTSLTFMEFSLKKGFDRIEVSKSVWRRVCTHGLKGPTLEDSDSSRG